MRRPWIVLFALALAACASAATTARVLEVGGEQNLRAPMRPIRGRTRVLIVALDGVSDPMLRRALDDGSLPSLATLLGDRDGDRWEHGYAAPDVLSVLPSLTIPGWAAIFTGETPARTGIVGNEYFDRAHRRFVAVAPGSVRGNDHAVRALTDDLLGRDLPVPTLFERAGVRSHVSLSPIHRGADLLTMASPWDLAQMLSVVPEGIAAGDVNAEAYRTLDEDSVDELVDGIEEQGLPDLQVVYLPGTDLVAHPADDPLDAQRRHLREVVDPLVARGLAQYRLRGALSRTYVVVVSDHGHTIVTPEGAISAERTAAALERIGFRVRPFELTTDAEYSAVLAYQGGLAYVYLADRSSCAPTCDWSSPPRLEEDVLAAARALERALNAELDLVLARRSVALQRDSLPFEVLDGDELVPVRAYLEAHPRPDLLRFADRLEALAAGPRGHRAGDVLLMSRLSSRWAEDERTYFGAPYRSFHGSPSAEDSIVPLLVAHSGSDGAELEAIVERALREDRSHLRTTELVLRLLDRPSR